jgi:hypothetical protein
VVHSDRSCPGAAKLTCPHTVTSGYKYYGFALDCLFPSLCGLTLESIGEVIDSAPLASIGEIMDSAALFVVYVVSISEVLCNANGAWSSNVLGLI